jgi:hypothetical protein
MSSTSAAAIRRDKFKSVHQDPEFGTITLATGGGASPFDTFRLPAGSTPDPPKPTFSGGRLSTSMGPPSTPPTARLGGVHKPPPTAVKSPAPEPALVKSPSIPALHKLPPTINKVNPSPAPVSSTPSWVTQKQAQQSPAAHAVSPPTSPRKQASPLPFAKSPSTSSVSPASSGHPTQAMGIHKLPPGVTAKAPPMGGTPKNSPSNTMSPPTSPRGGLRPTGLSNSSPNLGHPSQFAGPAGSPKTTAPAFGAPKKIGFAEAPATTAAPSPSPLKTASGHTKLSHHSRSISESHTAGSIVRSGVQSHSSVQSHSGAQGHSGAPSPGMVKRPMEAAVHHPPPAAAPNPSVSALKQTNFSRSVSVGAQNQGINSPAGGARPAPPGAKFPPSSPSKFPPTPM